MESYQCKVIGIMPYVERYRNMYVRKTVSLIQAWRLGDGTIKEKELLEKSEFDKTYQIVSQ